ncbi:hypothetical protein [Caldisalinibacter kiritimatiensis]|uniref:Uncharacterized protein n=1 Tax=Caldisalinibacter kiritimatiensis TaxID=1304284 RepID=R1CRM6_9FIRM|nr:hypothetical protein [Caldisalinibacter kiritimatiensis]EOD01326.1 hypothetical protein L21TH_0680 [Caldisalinibacter kiritimatiensis]
MFGKILKFVIIGIIVIAFIWTLTKLPQWIILALVGLLLIKLGWFLYSY